MVKAIAQDGGTITSIDISSGEEKQLLNLDANKVQMQYLGFYNGKVYYTTYNLNTYENKVSYKNIGTGEMKRPYKLGRTESRIIWYDINTF